MDKRELPVKIVQTACWAELRVDDKFGSKKQQKQQSLQLTSKSPYEEMSIELANGNGQVNGNNDGGPDGFADEMAQGNGRNNANKMKLGVDVERLYD
jgi:hypothetical protein